MQHWFHVEGQLLQGRRACRQWWEAWQGQVCMIPVSVVLFCHVSTVFCAGARCLADLGFWVLRFSVTLLEHLCAGETRLVPARCRRRRRRACRQRWEALQGQVCMISVYVVLLCHVSTMLFADARCLADLGFWVLGVSVTLLQHLCAGERRLVPGRCRRRPGWPASQGRRQGQERRQPLRIVVGARPGPVCMIPVHVTLLVPSRMLFLDGAQCLAAYF